MRPRSKLPIESFGPELMAALIHGSTKEFRFPLPFNDAVKFRRRVHQLRSRMREEKHEKAMLVERARVSILLGKDAGFETDPEYQRISNGGRVPRDRQAPALIVIKPYDVEFNAALKAAGVDIDLPDNGTSLRVPNALDPTSNTTEGEDPLASFDPNRIED